MNMREKFAELCHSQWSGWMKYLFSKCSKRADGSMIIPKWAVDRWSRQMQTPYHELSDDEMDSDRIEADKFIALISNYKKTGESICKYGKDNSKI